MEKPNYWKRAFFLLLVIVVLALMPKKRHERTMQDAINEQMEYVRNPYK